MDISKIEGKLLKISVKELLLYRMCQTLTYGMISSEEDSGFTNMPSKDDILDDMSFIIKNTSDLIKNNEQVTSKTNFKTEGEVGMLLLMREEFIREVSYELSYKIGTQGFFYSDSNVMTKELIEINFDTNKSFLRNVYINIASKNNVMKFFTGTMFLSNAVDQEEIFDLKFEQIVDIIPKMVVSIYAQEKFKSTKNTDYLKLIDEDSDDLELVVDEENTEANIRDFIDTALDALREANSGFINEMASILISDGRDQGQRL